MEILVLFLLVIGFILVAYGSWTCIFASNNDDKCKGYVAMACGLFLHTMCNLLVGNIFLTLFSFAVACVDCVMYRKIKKEIKQESISIKESFFRDLQEYKHKLDRKNYKII